MPRGEHRPLRLTVHESGQVHKDLDLEALATRPDLSELKAALAVIAATSADEDGVRFEPDTVSVETIREDDRYGGIRVPVVAHLESASDRIQIDVGFGDAVIPGPVPLTYPTLLPTLPAPDLAVYPMETVVAEKWEATVSLGEANTRMKDVIDLDEIAGQVAFDGALLQEAIRRRSNVAAPRWKRRPPCSRRSTTATERRQTLWAAARRRHGREASADSFREAMKRVLAFVGPPYLDAAEGRAFSGRWDPANRVWLPSTQQQVARSAAQRLSRKERRPGQGVSLPRVFWSVRRGFVLNLVARAFLSSYSLS